MSKESWTSGAWPWGGFAFGPSGFFEAGRAELARDPDAVRRIWERAEHYESWGECMANVGPDGLTLFAPLSALARASFLAVVRAGSRPEGIEWVRQILDRARQEVDQVYPRKKKES